MAQAHAVQLVLVDDGGRWLDSSPSDVAFGTIKLRTWQVTPIATTPATMPEHDAYLVQINYDMELEPGVPTPRWFEIGFTFRDPAGAAIVVVDAVPHTVLEKQPTTSYAVGDDLGFRHGDRFVLPPVAPTVDVFGIGGPQVRWRHSSFDGTRPGSYAAWVALAAPAGTVAISVAMSARYDLAPDEALGLLPATAPASFDLLLTTPDPEPIKTTEASTEPTRPDRPRVFVCYAHDGPSHVETVRKFCEFLAECGIDVHVDRWDLDRRRDWYEWAIDQITSANFIIVIASPDCRAVGDGGVPADRNRGLKSEITLLRELLHQDRPRWHPRLLPVLLPGRSEDHIPLFLQPYTADHYPVTDLTIAGAIDLLRALTGQPEYRRPRVADRVVDLTGGDHSA